MIDLGFVGQKYTWMTRRGISEEIWERLDRAVCSNSWRIKFAEGFVKHLPRINSDHCPLLLLTRSNHMPEARLKPFRFEAMWLKHKEFVDVIKKNWKAGRILLVTYVISLES
ncbi:hypothetical protein ACOSP7_013098 [Xanthoceras sorbifolium]